MLEQVRRSTKSGFSYILVGLLIVVFAVFFGAPADGCRASGGRVLMASAAGYDVYTDDVNIIYNRVYGSQRQSDDAQFLSQQAMSLRAVILTHLVADLGKKAGLRVSDDEFRAYILDPNRNIEFRWVYGRDGSFDGPLYKAYVQNQLRVSIPKYEEFKRQELLARKYMALVDMQIGVTPQEVDELNDLRNNQVDLEFVKFSSAMLADFIDVSDADLQAFLASEKEKIKADFEANRSKYEEPEQVLIRRVFIVKPEGEAELKQAAQRFATAKERVETEDFADVAGQLTEDYAKERQGLMEWSTLENLDQNIAAKVAGADVGTVHEIDTDFAFMLVKLEDRKEAKSTPLAEVQDEIAARLLQEQKVTTIGTELAEKLLERAKTTESLADALAALKAETKSAAAPVETAPVVDETGAEDHDEAPAAKSPWDAVSVGSTGFFSLEGQDMSAMFGNQFPGLQLGRSPWDRVPEIGKSAELAAAAFKLTSEQPLSSKVFEVDKAHVVVRLKERKDSSAELTDAQRLELASEARSIRAIELLGGWPTLFAVPSDDYGPWLERIYKDSVSSGAIRFFDANSPAVPMARQMANPSAAAMAMPFEVEPG